MEYKALPFASIWDDGIINLPARLVDEYIKLASEYQLKALLYIFRRNGCATTQEIAKALGQTVADTDNLLEFWVEEGVLSADGKAIEIEPQAEAQSPKEETVTVKKAISAPTLSPKDIVVILREDKSLQALVNEAQTVLGRTISSAEQAIIINMVNYYGLKAEIVLMLLGFYKTQREKGLSISFSYINTMAKSWSDEGIDSIDAAEEKLRQLERSDRLWNEVTAITGIRHKKPTVKQRDMITRWFEDFDVTMITLAADIMKENIPEPKLAYINSILEKWKKANIKTPADVENEQREFAKKKEKKAKNGGKLSAKPSYDLEQIKQNAMNNTDI